MGILLRNSPLVDGNERNPYQTNRKVNLRGRGENQMLNNHPIVRWLLIALSVLLLIPLVVMLGTMVIGALTGAAMMSQMGGMMGGMRGMSAPMMGLCATWLGLVAAALVLLIVFLARDVSHV